MTDNNHYQIVPVPAFKDNYLWVLRRGDAAAVVDPERANPDPRCQPINAAGTAELPGECFLPFPSTFYEKADPSTA